MLLVNTKQLQAAYAEEFKDVLQQGNIDRRKPLSQKSASAFVTAIKEQIQAKETGMGLLQRLLDFVKRHGLNDADRIARLDAGRDDVTDMAAKLAAAKAAEQYAASARQVADALRAEAEQAEAKAAWLEEEAKTARAVASDALRAEGAATTSAGAAGGPKTAAGTTPKRTAAGAGPSKEDKAPAPKAAASGRGEADATQPGRTRSAVAVPPKPAVRSDPARRAPRAPAAVAGSGAKAASVSKSTGSKRPREPSPEEDSEEKDGFFTIESFIKSRGKGPASQLLVRWEGFGPEADTWEKERKLRQDLEPKVFKQLMEEMEAR
ncbi:hypothetical protein HYH03_014926 [Edaphochlamys debaryana]|uniref:Chromo domain-containing protein n=1 Tax=Edaphochlamys debaryana TaxID=47281 RepID=A0A835XMQ0_9CHLO|nr:hypothetical protein HYH03_014926 [Edaphochlamys debaryana]|eukprot:KAG2486344.1 hypothetical protein HYH03_014926 [Edaphochlamys debaryana]